MVLFCHRRQKAKVRDVLFSYLCLLLLSIILVLKWRIYLEETTAGRECSQSVSYADSRCGWLSVSGKQEPFFSPSTRQATEEATVEVICI